MKMPEQLKAGEITITNTGKSAKTICIYVPNKDMVPYTMAAGETFKVTTLSAGESYTYIAQATDTLTVELG